MTDASRQIGRCHVLGVGLPYQPKHSEEQGCKQAGGEAHDHRCDSQEGVRMEARETDRSIQARHNNDGG